MASNGTVDITAALSRFDYLCLCMQRALKDALWLWRYEGVNDGD